MAAHLDDSSKAVLSASYPSVSLAESDAAAQSAQAFPTVEYSAEDKAIVKTWAAGSDPSEAKLRELNSHLASRTTLLGSKPSIADAVLYLQLAPVIKSWNSNTRTGANGYHHIVRWADFVQNSSLIGLKISEADKINIDADDVVAKIPPVDAKAEKERKKKEKEAAAAAAAGGAAAGTAAAKEPTIVETVTSTVAAAVEQVKAAVTGEAPEAPKQAKPKKEKQPKQPKPQKAAAPEKPLSPSLIDLRVGHILKCERHPNADSLFVSTIAMGDPAGTDNTHEFEGQVCRTVCSGLNGLVPLEDMQRRYIVAVANLKPVTMRGIKSAAMVLAASPKLKEGEVDTHAGPVELVELPAGSVAGERVYFDGWRGEPEGVLNPKKKIWETLQPGFTTTADKVVAFDVAAVEALKDSGKSGLGELRTEKGVCTVKTLGGATVR